MSSILNKLSEAGLRNRLATLRMLRARASCAALYASCAFHSEHCHDTADRLGALAEATRFALRGREGRGL